MKKEQEKIEELVELFNIDKRELKVCINLLKRNGYTIDTEKEERIVATKKHRLGIDFMGVINLFDEANDICELPVNKFALLGALIHFRQMPQYLPDTF